MIEVWKDIPGFELVYQASTYGRIKRIASGPSTCRGRILKPTIHHSGYLDVSLCKNSKQYKSLRIHSLILLTFSGPRPPRYQCRHLDGNKHNNYLSNLEWGTQAENAKDRIRHGRYTGVCGSKNTKSKLTEKQVKRIKKLICDTPKHKHNKSTTLKQIAQEYGVAISTLSSIKNGKTWKHVEITNVQSA